MSFLKQIAFRSMSHVEDASFARCCALSITLPASILLKQHRPTEDEVCREEHRGAAM